MTGLRSRAMLTAVVLLVLGGLTTACGGAKVDPALKSSVSAKFTTPTVQGKRYIVGHAIAMEMPAPWVTYEPEKLSADQTSYEWAAGLPADTQPVPAGVQFSMGVPDKGVQFSTLPEGAKQLAESSPGYKYLDSGVVKIAGAEHAKFLRFDRDLELNSGTKKVEQVSLFIEVKKGVTSTIRFIASAGDWDKQLKATYDSVRVVEGKRGAS